MNVDILGSPYTMQVPRELSYEDLQKLMLKEMAPILHDDILTSSQPQGVSKLTFGEFLQNIVVNIIPYILWNFLLNNVSQHDIL